MNLPEKDKIPTEIVVSEEELSLQRSSFQTRSWLKQNLVIPTLMVIAGCTTPRLSDALELGEIPTPDYPEVHVLGKNKPPVHLNIFSPGPSITAELLPAYKECAEKIKELLETSDKYLEFHISEVDVRDYVKPLAMELGTYKNIETANIIILDAPCRSDPSIITAKIESPIKLDLLPETSKLLVDHSCRIYVADGAFMQGELGCFSSWVLLVANALEQRLPGLSINVQALRYAEKTSIKTSAKQIATMIEEDLLNNPLQPGEEILLLGHSQGGFILSYLANAAVNEEAYANNIPWGMVRRIINVDLPMNVTNDYQGNYELLVDPTLFIARHDILIFPLLCEIFFPAGNDYLRNTDAYDMIKNNAPNEYRLQRKSKDGHYINPTVPGGEIDNPNCQFEHHPFLSYRGYHNRQIREEVIKLIISTLPVIAPSASEIKPGDFKESQDH
jgi:hypothetical protein